MNRSRSTGKLPGRTCTGQSNVHSESRVLLDPSADEWQLELKADGVVDFQYAGQRRAGAVPQPGND